MDAKTFSLMVSSQGHEWFTPLALFKKLDKEFDFTTDPCAEPTNRLGVKIFYTKEQDGLRQKWKGNVFINPPYGRTGKVQDWFKKASEYKDGVVVFLIPARTDTKWWAEYIWDGNNHRPYPHVQVRFIKGRIKFESPNHVSNTAPFPSAVVIFK
jgi:phage N-6-adenine-methyltransferase